MPPASSASDHNSGFRPDINALRALAVLAVIAFHFDLGATAGYIGVDIFFVLSGFLIGGQIIAQMSSGEFNVRSFFVSRIRRIVPALAIVCLVIVAWGWLYQLPIDYKRQTKDAAFALLFVSNIMYAGQIGYFDPSAEYKPLLHTWSLSVEGQFYLLLPFILLAVFHLPVRFRVRTVWALALASFVAALILSKESPQSAFFSFAARAWEFLIGNLLAWHTRSGKLLPGIGEKVRQGMIAGLWGLLIAACFFLPEAVSWPGPWTLVPTLLTVAIVGLGTFGGTHSWLKNGLIQHLGNISYSLYLWHWPLLICWNLTMTEPASLANGSIWFLLAITWGISWLSWRFVEQPIRRNRSAWTAQRLLKGYSSAAFVFVLVAGVTSLFKGFPSRLPTYFAAVRAAEELPRRESEGCWQVPGASDRHARFACDLGEPNAIDPTFALWGDSHAFHLLDSLRAAVAQTNASGLFFHYPACEPAFTKGAPIGELCDGHNDGVVKILAQTPSISTVVLAIRQNNAQRNARTWETAQLLIDKGYTVIFLGPLPESTRPVAQEWAKIQLLARQSVPEVTVSRTSRTQTSPFDERLSAWRQTAQVFQARHPGQFVPLDLSNVFCNAQDCWLVKDGVGLFRDTDHLTAAGSKKVVSMLMPALNLEKKTSGSNTLVAPHRPD